MTSQQVTCLREMCPGRVDAWWAPWCSEDCYRIAVKVSDVVAPQPGQPQMALAAPHFAFPWLDVRSSG